jgi:hypothetical protein
MPGFDDLFSRQVTPERAVTVISQTISAFPIDHRVAVVGFFEQLGWPVDQTADAVTGGPLRATFDELGRIAQLSGTIRTR